MANLDDYRVWEYDQGEALRKQYAFKPAVQKGICVNLMIEWTRDYMASPAGSASARKATVEGKFKMAAMRQMAYEDAFKVTSYDPSTRSGGGMGYEKIAEMLTAMGRQFGVKFEYSEWGSSYDPFATAVVKKKYWDRFLYLDLQFTGGGGHAIGVRCTKGAIEVFDPNLGEFKVSTTGTAVKTFASLLWAQYATWSLPVGHWGLLLMDQQESVMSMFQKGKIGKK